MLRSARRHRRERWVVGSIVAVAVALVLVLLFQIGFFDSLLPGSRSASPPASRSGAPSEPAVFALDPIHPFAASPAASWPDGAAGIVVPPTAGPVNGYTADQVAKATGQVRDVLIASRLDHAMLVNHDPRTYLAALAPDARRQLEPLFGSGREAEVQSLVSMAAQNSRLLPAEPKVNGTMSVAAGAPGELVVHTNYVFVYAFRPDSDKLVDMMDILVVVRADVDYILRTGDRWTTGSQGWWYGTAGGYAYSIACDAYHNGYLAPAFTERTAAEAAPQDRDVYFNPKSPLPPATGCPQ